MTILNLLSHHSGNAGKCFSDNRLIARANIDPHAAESCRTLQGATVPYPVQATTRYTTQPEQEVGYCSS